MRWRVIILCVIAACASIIGIDDPQVGTPTGNCTTFPCDIVPQCGCGTGSACDTSSTGNACRSAGSGTEATLCTADTDCAAGYTCSSRGGMSYCERYCTSGSNCESPRGKCLTDLATATTPVVCTSGCDPLSTTNTDCPSGWSCDIYRLGSGSGSDVVDCRPPGTASAGQSCASAICGLGLTCVVFSNGSQTCEPICSPNTNTSCPSGSCHGFSTPFVVAGTEYGPCD
jgi:hypothetical protein